MSLQFEKSLELAFGKELAVEKHNLRFGARLRSEMGQAFRSLRNPHYRTYAAGQLVSLTGTWMQSVAFTLLAYKLTGSAAMLGAVALASYVPVLLLGLFGGQLADRLPRRKILIVTQTAEMLVAGVATVLVFSGHMQPWTILAAAAANGICLAFEMAARQAFTHDLVGGEDVVNAVSLNSVMWNSSRMFGPALGALVLAFAGEGVCFALNTVSFLASILTLKVIRTQEELGLAAPKPKRTDKSEHPLLDGLKLSWSTLPIRNILVLALVISFFGFQYSVLLPVFVKQILKAPEWSLGVLQACIAFGALAGSLALASRGKGNNMRRIVCAAAVVFGLTLFAFAWSNVLALTVLSLMVLGLSMSVVWSGTNAFLQVIAPEEYRGRIMSVYSSISLGISPFGSLLMGTFADAYGAPLAVTVCACACALVAGFYVLTASKEK